MSKDLRLCINGSVSISKILLNYSVQKFRQEELVKLAKMINQSFSPCFFAIAFASLSNKKEKNT
jgi:hypothetical protein